MGKRYSFNSFYSLVAWIVLLAMLFVVVQGCGSAHSKRLKLAREQMEEAYEFQKPLQVRTSLEDKRPKWTHYTAYEDAERGVVYFSGGYMDGADWSVTVRCANAEALKAAVQGISQFVRAEFSQYATGANSGAGGVDRHVSDGIAAVTDNMHIQGIRQSELYYEEVFTPGIMQSSFNIWVRLEIPKVEYLKLKADAVRKLRDRFGRDGQEEAKEKAEQLLDDLKSTI